MGGLLWSRQEPVESRPYADPDGTPCRPRPRVGDIRARHQLLESDLTTLGALEVGGGRPPIGRPPDHLHRLPGRVDQPRVRDARG